MIKKLIYLLLLLTVFDVAYCQDLDEEIGEGTTFEYNKHYPRGRLQKAHRQLLPQALHQA